MKRFCLLWLCFLFWSSFCAVGFTDVAEEIIFNRNGKIIFKARDSTLKEIAREFHEKYSIEIKGLESNESTKVTFSFEADTVEALLKRLLQYLGIKNYAIEFTDATLKRVVVVPEAKGVVAAQAKQQTSQTNQKEFISIARIKSIIESTQAESAGLNEGDIILEYDGIQITNARQLVNEVEKKTMNDRVELLIAREKTPMRFHLVGGYIGIRIMTERIAKEDFDAFYLFD